MGDCDDYDVFIERASNQPFPFQILKACLPVLFMFLCTFDQRAPRFLPVVVCTEPYVAELQELPGKPGPNKPLVMIETIPECMNRL